MLARSSPARQADICQGRTTHQAAAWDRDLSSIASQQCHDGNPLNHRDRVLASCISSNREALISKLSRRDHFNRISRAHARSSGSSTGGRQRIDMNQNESLIGLRASRVESTPAIPMGRSSFTRELALGEVWPLLASGHGRITSSSWKGNRCSVEIEETVPPARWVELEEGIAIVERILLGESQKSIAIGLRCAASKVTFRASAALHGIGVRCTARSVPTALVMLARVHHGQATGLDGDLRRESRGGRSFLSVRMMLPSNWLADGITPAERAVVEGIIEGWSHREIALRRGTSVRTIANQVAALYKKLRVTDRICLIGRLLVVLTPPR